MSVRLRNGFYHVDICISPTERIQEKIKPATKNKSIAKAYEQDLRNKILRGKLGLSQANPSLANMVSQYLEFSKVNKAPNSYRRDEYILRTFSELSGIKSFSGITPLAMERFKAKWQQRGVSPSTINTGIVIVKAMLNKLVKLRVIPDNPIRVIEKMSGDEERPIEYLTEKEVEALLKAATHTFRPIFACYILTGLRKKELIYLEWKDIEFEARRINVVNKPENKIKRYRVRSVNFDETLESILRSVKKRGTYVFPTKDKNPRTNNLLRELKRTAKKAGIEKNVTIHMLRHTYASHLIMAGVDLPTVKKLMGQSCISTTMIYSHLSPDHLEAAVKKLPFKNI